MKESECRKPLAIDARGVGQLLQVSTRTVWRLDSAGKLPASVRVGGRPRWRRQELEQWVAAGCPSRDVWDARKN